MIYNLNSIDRIINTIVRNLGIGDTEIPYQDYIEWIADGLEHIGSYAQFEESHSIVVIDNYSGKLPCNFYKPIRMRASAEIKPASYGLYGGSLVDMFNKIGIDYESLPMNFRVNVVNGKGLQTPTNSYNDVLDHLNFNKNLIGNPEINSFTSNDYNINFNNITTAFRYGLIDLQYLSFPVDDRGFPLVPDDVSFRDALFWKVTYQICMRNPKLLSNPVMKELQYCKLQWEQYCRQARASANMPNLGQMERFKNTWNKLIPNHYAEYANYYDIGKPQILNLNGRS